MNRHRITLLFLLAASLLLSLFYIPRYNEISGDKEVYRYAGLLLHKGGVPYRDVFDHKPPLIFFVNYVGVLLNGWAQWFIDATLALLATFLFYRLGRKYQIPLPWVPPLLFNLMIRDHLLCLGIGMTREYTAIFVIFFFCIFLGKHRFRYFALGAISGAIFFMQQDQVLQLLPFFLYSFLPGSDPSPVGGRVLRTFLGFASVALPLILYFAWNNALSFFWKDAFLFNLGWYTQTLPESFRDHLIKLKTLMDIGNYEVAVLVTVTLGVCASLFPASQRKLIIIALLAVPLSIVTEFMGGRDQVPKIYQATFTHYVLPLAASIPILLFCVFAFTREPVLSGYKAQGIFSFLVFFSLAYTALQHGTHLKSKDIDEVAESPEIAYIRQQRPPDYQFYVFGSINSLYIANEVNALAPSPWIYQHFWRLYPDWDADLRLLHSIEEDVRRHQTTFILDLTDGGDWFSNPRADAEWHGFLRDNYQPVMENQHLGSVLWKRKEAR
ncbi:hypothetical protein [Puia sp.]|uniref:hypothetical protein n=1 Tax=Puia sp. TaxID=2045100 RepID=UPI002F3F0E3B